MRPDLHDALDTVDAALFSGNYFTDTPDARIQLREMMQRWLRRLDEQDADSAGESLDFSAARTDRHQTATPNVAQEPRPATVPTDLDAAMALARELATDPVVLAQVAAARAEAKAERERFERSRLIPRGLLDIPIRGCTVRTSGEELATLGKVLSLCNRLDQRGGRTTHSRDWDQQVWHSPNGAAHWNRSDCPTDDAHNVAFIAEANPISVGLLTATIRALVAHLELQMAPAS